MTSPDLSVYDLAERAAAGMPVSSAAVKEIAAELLAVRERMTEWATELDHTDITGKFIAMEVRNRLHGTVTP
jgi:hypothetical protein